MVTRIPTHPNPNHLCRWLVAACVAAVAAHSSTRVTAFKAETACKATKTAQTAVHVQAKATYIAMCMAQPLTIPPRRCASQAGKYQLCAQVGNNMHAYAVSQEASHVT